MDPITLGLIASAVIAGGSQFAGGMMANQERGKQVTAANSAAYQIADADRRDSWQQFGATMDFNRDQAQVARDFSERMSSTAYQRAVLDMKAAGINPMLAYAQGGASTPSGGGASVSQSTRSGAVPMQIAQVDNVLGPAVSSAMQAASAFQGLQQTAAQVDQTRANTQYLEAETHRSNQQAGYLAAETGRSSEQSELVRRLQQTELERQRQLSAQAGLHSAQTVTEGERQSLMREQGRQSAEEANLARERRHQLETYGPPGVVSSSVGGVSALVDQIGRSLGLRQLQRNVQ